VARGLVPWSGGGLWYALIALVCAAAMPAFARDVLIIAGATEGATTHDLPVIESNLLGAHFRIVSGYPGMRENTMAIDAEHMKLDVAATSGGDPQAPVGKLFALPPSVSAYAKAALVYKPPSDTHRVSRSLSKPLGRRVRRRQRVDLRQRLAIAFGQERHGDQAEDIEQAEDRCSLAVAAEPDNQTAGDQRRDR
jgi:hypothetical protein